MSAQPIWWSIKGWTHHGVRAVIQVCAAWIGLWFSLKLALVIDIFGAKRMDEESFLIPLVLGGGALFCVALLSYAIVVRVFKSSRCIKLVSYRHVIVIGFIQGLLLFPCLAVVSFFWGQSLVSEGHLQGGWEAAGIVSILVVIILTLAALSSLLWVLFLQLSMSNQQQGPRLARGQAMRKTFPDLPEWCFEIDEVSSGVYEVIGRDMAGHCVSAK